MSSTAQYFDKRSEEWEELYQRDPRFARRFEVLTNFIAPLLKKHDVRRALDYGCGTGLYSRWLESQGIEVTGLDISEQMLRRAQELSNSITFTSDLSQVAASKFDAILALSVLEYVEDVERLLKAFTAATNKGGLLIASIPNSKGAVRQIERTAFGLRKLTNGKVLGDRGDYLSHQRWQLTPKRFDEMIESLGYRKVGERYYNAAFNAPQPLLPFFEKKWWAALYAGAYVKL